MSVIKMCSNRVYKLRLLLCTLCSLNYLLKYEIKDLRIRITEPHIYVFPADFFKNYL